MAVVNNSGYHLALSKTGSRETNSFSLRCNDCWGLKIYPSQICLFDILTVNQRNLIVIVYISRLCKEVDLVKSYCTDFFPPE